MKHHSWIIGLSLCGFAVVGGIGQDAAAASLPGIAGRAKNPSDFACFAPAGTSEPSLKNTCADTKQLWIPATIDTEGRKTVRASVYGGATTKRINCVAVAYDRDALMMWESGNIATTGVNPSYQTLDLGTVSVPATDGTLYFACGVQTGGVVNSVFWSEF